MIAGIPTRVSQEPEAVDLEKRVHSFSQHATG